MCGLVQGNVAQRKSGSLLEAGWTCHCQEELFLIV